MFIWVMHTNAVAELIKNRCTLSVCNFLRTSVVCSSSRCLFIEYSQARYDSTECRGYFNHHIVCFNTKFTTTIANKIKRDKNQRMENTAKCRDSNISRVSVVGLETTALLFNSIYTYLYLYEAIWRAILPVACWSCMFANRINIRYTCDSCRNTMHLKWFRCIGNNNHINHRRLPVHMFIGAAIILKLCVG